MRKVQILRTLFSFRNNIEAFNKTAFFLGYCQSWVIKKALREMVRPLYFKSPPIMEGLMTHFLYAPLSIQKAQTLVTSVEPYVNNALLTTIQYSKNAISNRMQNIREQGLNAYTTLQMITQVGVGAAALLFLGVFRMSSTHRRLQPNAITLVDHFTAKPMMTTLKQLHATIMQLLILEVFHFLINRQFTSMMKAQINNLVTTENQDHYGLSFYFQLHSWMSMVLALCNLGTYIVPLLALYQLKKSDQSATDITVDVIFDEVIPELKYQLGCKSS